MPRGLDDSRVPIDYTELRGRTYRCIDGCALCCLCQPELLPEEEARFRASSELADAVTERHISPDARGAGIKLKGAHGACWFLENRRCRIYEQRPHFCRTFPINVFVGRRVQLNANLSCRGIGVPGEGLERIGREVVASYGLDRLREELDKAAAVYDEFEDNCKAARVMQPASSLREAGKALMEDLVDPIGLARILTYATAGDTPQNATAQEVVKRTRRTEPEEDLGEAALAIAVDLFDLPELSHLPVYIDESLRWHIFRLVDDRIVAYSLGEDGGISEEGSVEPSEVDLMKFGSGGADAMKSYLRIVNMRDCFLGHAAYMCDSEDYQFNFAQVYLGVLARNALDLWWRCSFLAHIAGKQELGRREVREGIVFFDMDLLDLPSIGAFI
ncbi:MAG: YkgJ family cysteine cluster protein [Thermoplasmata archaeon]